MTIFKMIDTIYHELDKKFYDDLNDYEKGLKDIINLLDCRMSGNDEDEMFADILDSIK